MAPDAESIFTTAANLANASVPDVTGQIDSGIKLGMVIIEAKEKMEQNRQLVELRKQELLEKRGHFVLDYWQKANSTKNPKGRKFLIDNFPAVYETAYGVAPSEHALSLMKNLPEESSGELPTSKEVADAIADPVKRAELIRTGKLQTFMQAPDPSSAIDALEKFGKPEVQKEVANIQFQGKQLLESQKERASISKQYREELIKKPWLYNKISQETWSALDAGDPVAKNYIQTVVAQSSRLDSLLDQYNKLQASGGEGANVGKVDVTDPNAVAKANAKMSAFLSVQKKADKALEMVKDEREARKEVLKIDEDFKDQTKVFTQVKPLIDAQYKRYKEGKTINPSAMIVIAKGIMQFSDSPRVTDAELKMGDQQAGRYNSLKQYLETWLPIAEKYKDKDAFPAGTMPPGLIEQAKDIFEIIEPSINAVKMDEYISRYNGAKAAGHNLNNVFGPVKLKKIEDYIRSGSKKTSETEKAIISPAAPTSSSVVKQQPTIKFITLDEIKKSRRGKAAIGNETDPVKIRALLDAEAAKSNYKIKD